jgi:DNA-binding CsgD family transcriptional regulator
MLSGEESLLRVIDSLYDAATDATKWSAALERIAGLFDACAMTLLQITQNGAGAVFASTGISPESGDLYDRYYVGKDLTVKAALMLPVGTFSGSDMVISKKEWDRSEMVADLLLPNGLFRIAGSVLLRDESGFASLGMHRPRSAREFDDHDERTYQIVQPHLQRALEVTRMLARASEERDALADSLDCLATGVVILDGEGRTLLANRTATDLAAAGDGFALGRQGPAGAHSNDTAALRKRIAEAASTDGTSRCEAPGHAVLLERPSGRKSLEVLAVPLGRGNSLNGHGRVVLFITDPEREASPPTEWLRQLYDLTCAEAKLAISLANGASLTETADQFHVTRNTMRTHLQRAMSKTDTRRQGELIRLVLGGPAGMVAPGSERTIPEA